MTYEITLNGRVVDAHGRPLDSDALDTYLDVVMDQLIELEEGDKAIHDPDISARLATGEVAVALLVEADDPSEAIAKGFAVIRCAVHAAGGYTPDWEPPSDVRWALEFQASSQRRLEQLTD